MYTAALRTAVSVPSNKTGWVAVAGDLEASTSATGAGASAPQLLTRAEYLLMLTSDYCFTETNQSHSRRLEMSDAAAAEALALAGPAGATSAAGMAAARMVEAQNAWRRVSEADGGVDATVEVFEAEDPDRTRQRRLSHGQEGDEMAEEAYRAELAAALLSCADTACIQDALVRSLPPSSPPSPPLSAFGAMTAARPWELVSTQDQILVQRWAAVEGLGQWFRIVLPRTALVAELYLLNVPPLSGQLDPEPPPEAGCTANECAPLEVKRGAVLVGFHRRLDLLEAAGRVDANGEADARGCASIGTVTHLAADTISVQQDPPEDWRRARLISLCGSRSRCSTTMTSDVSVMASSVSTRAAASTTGAQGLCCGQMCVPPRRHHRRRLHRHHRHRLPPPSCRRRMRTVFFENSHSAMCLVGVGSA